MKQILILLALGASLFINQEAESQQLTCGSELNLSLIQQVNPSLYARIIAVEQQTQNYINALNTNTAVSSRLIDQNGTIVIPVVVHVLHRGEPIGVGRNISDAQIHSQMDVLNEDFRRLNADRVNTPAPFQLLAADVNIEFRLACIDPNGNPTSGITRTFAGRDQFSAIANPDGTINENATGIKFTNNGGIDAWATSKYLNIWVCDLGELLFGYSQFPAYFISKPNTDGVVVLFNAFGRVGNLLSGLDKGRTCCHEIGHYFNLRHIWGDANCGNDFVDDTPQQERKNLGCLSFPHTSNCTNNGSNGDMFMNYMDYTNNSCMNLFTTGQRLRMRALFAQGGAREKLYYSIQQATNPICNTGTVTAFTGLCNNSTNWTVVSGPVSIIGGQGTNTLSLQQTGNGVATIRATSGNYFDERQVNVDPPTPAILSPFGNVKNLSTGYTKGSLKLLSGSYDQWYLNGVIRPSAPLGTLSFEVPTLCTNTQSYYSISLKGTNGCGTFESCGSYIYNNSCTLKTLRGSVRANCHENERAANRFILSKDSVIAHSMKGKVATYTDDEYASLYMDPETIANEMVQSVIIYDLQGNIVQEAGSINAKTISIDLTGLAEGMYNVAVRGNNEYTEQQTYKILVTKTEKEFDEEIATDNYFVNDADSTDIKEVLKQQLFKELKAKEALVNASVILKDFLETRDMDNYGFIQKIIKAFDNDELILVHDILNHWTAQNDQDQNCIDYFNFYLRVLELNPLSTTDISDLYVLANKCPLKDGEIIYAARDLYNYLTEANETFEYACGGNASRAAHVRNLAIKNAQASLTAKHSSTVTRVYPNPAKGSFTIDFPVSEKGNHSVTIMDVYGKQILQSAVSEAVNNILLPIGTAPGVYMLRIVNSETKKTEIKKLVVANR